LNPKTASEVDELLATSPRHPPQKAYIKNG